MRSRLASAMALLLAVPAAAGCANSPRDRLQGRWVGERAENLLPQQAARAQGWVAGTSFEFKGSRVTVSIPAESPRQGTFKVAQLSENELAVTFLRPQGTEDRVTFRLEDDDRLRWMLADGRSIVLRKVDN